MQNPLSSSDPSPVERLGGCRHAPILLVCEHAGNAIPQSLIEYAPNGNDMARHIAYDVGAEYVARCLAKKLGVPLVIQRYSRLIIDCNRPRSAPDLAPEMADGSAIKFNHNLDETSLDMRWQSIHQPFHQAVGEVNDQHPGAALVTIHSFTPLLNGVERPWHVGFLARRNFNLANSMLAYFSQTHSDIVTALNQPYQIDDDTDYTIPVHGERHDKPHVLIEIRNDLIKDVSNAQAWAQRLAAGLSRFVTAHNGV